MSSEEASTLSSNPSSKNISEESNEDISENETEESSTREESDGELSISSGEGNEENPNESSITITEGKNIDYLELYNKKSQECYALYQRNEILKNKINVLEKKIIDQQENIEKLININEQIMRDKELIYGVLQKINQEKTQVENELNYIKSTTFSPVDTNISYTCPPKDVKVVNLSFDKYIFIKYSTSKPLGIICLFNEQKQARVVSSFTCKTEELSLEEYFYYQPEGKGNGLKVKDGDQVLSMTSQSNQLITVTPLLPLFDRFHKVSQTSPILIGKREYYMTVLDLTTISKSDQPHELRAFGVIFETEITQKKPGMIDVYDGYLEMFRQINRGVIISYVASFNYTPSILIPITREVITKPFHPPNNGIMYFESKLLKIDKYHIPHLFPIPYLSDESYSIAFYYNEAQDRCHIIDVI
ncbi:Hypothetical protein EHI5A_062490 [Entamoeba histolytica KU27]|uniref:Uncharacterized protein n=1 Tax=Entamoeba histolytica KU27 TaxID=885311 RepID=M2RQZ1_ENTHI|nr:Hypothetical protein EHI5A_062490 [Entamoeba histolytica KU27]